MPEDIKSITEIPNKEGYDFKFEVGYNDAKDKIVRVMKSPVGTAKYTRVMEMLINEAVVDTPSRTELQALKVYIPTSNVFTQKEKDTIISWLNTKVDNV